MEKVRDLKQMYALCLSVPSMNDPVKIDLKISRKNILFLSQIIQNGLQKENIANGELLSVISKESQDELATLASEFLQKVGLVELSAQLRQL